MPVVLINSHNEQGRAHLLSIGVNNRHGGFLAAEHLLGLGHRCIAYVTGTPNHSDDRERLAGYCQALDGASVPREESLIIPGTGRADGATRVLERLLALRPVPTAAFCYNDMTAIGLLWAARQAGLETPRDLAIVGFDDIPFASYVFPALTTIAQPMFEMGQRAVEAALAHLGPSAVSAAVRARIALKGHLIVRESTGPCESMAVS